MPRAAIVSWRTFGTPSTSSLGPLHSVFMTTGPESAAHVETTDAEAMTDLTKKIGPLLLISVLIGIGGALAASLFLAVESGLQTLIWTDIPAKMGLGETASWYVLAALLVGAIVVLLAQKLPGKTGASPISGFHFDVGPGTIASVALAALGTLAFGLVLGPEAPLIACGTALGGLVMRGRGPQAVQLGMLLGGVAGIGAIFGNPLITAFMILEFAALGPLPAAALLPVLVALGSGYIVEIGLGPWSGLGTHSLALPGLPAFPGLTVVNIVGGLVIGVIASIVALIARELGERVDDASKKRPTPILFAVAIVTALLAIGTHLITGEGYETVLFSGQEAMPTILGITSVGTLLVILVAKFIAYGLALGGGFRGGPIFPAVFLGVTIGTIASLIVPDLTLPGMAAVGIAATTAAMTKLPFTGTMLGVLLISSAGGAVTPLAIIGAVIGFMARTALDRYDAKRGDVAIPVKIA